MTDITIKTNGHPRELMMLAELPESVVRHDFSYMAEDWDNKSDECYTKRFFEYRGAWYDTHEFQMAPDALRERGWYGAQPESYFSAVLIKYPFEWDSITVDYDSVVVGYAHW